jgi:hypothetical protein
MSTLSYKIGAQRAKTLWGLFLFPFSKVLEALSRSRGPFGW